jgi:hypothetical protein
MLASSSNVSFHQSAIDRALAAGTTADEAQPSKPGSSFLQWRSLSLRLAFDQLNEYIPVTRLRLAPAAEHLARELLPCTSDELGFLRGAPGSCL